MSTLSVFYEKNIYFGVFSDDYTEMYPMNYFFIKHHNPLDYIWHFDYPLKNMQGSICNVGAMLDKSVNTFSKDDEVFFIRTSRKYFGVKLANKQMSINIVKEKCKLEENTDKSDITNFSLNMLIKKYFVKSSKKIYIIEPGIISEAFRMIA